MSAYDGIVDLLATDDRPSCIVHRNDRDTSLGDKWSPYEIIYRNAALESFNATLVDKRLSFDSWLNDQHAVRTGAVADNILLGVFGGQHWIARSLSGGRRTIITCHKQSWTTTAHHAIETKTAFVRLASRDTAVKVPEKYTDILVDWILHPEIVTDPWISFLLKHDWAGTAIGPIQSWPSDLRKHVIAIMSSPEPRCILWGDDMILIYNEAVVPRVSSTHPAGLGPLIEAKPLSFQMLRRFETLYDAAGFLEESYFNYLYTPICNSNGTCDGFLFEYIETTAIVFQTNRDKVLTRVEDCVVQSRTLTDFWSACIDTVGSESDDISYALLFVVNHFNDPTNEHSAISKPSHKLGPSYGVDRQVFESIASTGLGDTLIHCTDTTTLLQSRTGTLPAELAIEVSRGLVSHAYVVTIASSIGAPIARIVLGMNPRRHVSSSLAFVKTLSNVLARSIALVRQPEEREEFEKANMALVDQLRTARMRVEKNAETLERWGKYSPAGMFMLGPKGEPLFANDAYLKMLHISREEFFGTGNNAGQPAWDEIYHQDDIIKIQQSQAELYLNQKPTTYTLRTRKDAQGIQHWVEGVAFTETDDLGHVVSVQGWQEDITHRKLAEQLQDERLHEAIVNKRSAEQFLDMISHEIRNPLSAAVLLVDEIQSTVLHSINHKEEPSPMDKEKIVDAADTLTISLKHQHAIVDEVLELSKLDSGLLTLIREKTDTLQIFKTTLRMFSADISAYNIDMPLRILPSYSELVSNELLLDSAKLTKVLINLISNAIKFTKASERRSITIALGASRNKPVGEDMSITFVSSRAKVTPDASGPSTDSFEPSVNDRTAQKSEAELANTQEIYLQCTVEDTRRGLDEDELGNLFQRFSQASPKTYQRYGGSGLGLYISRQTVELHGGQIGVKSSRGVGSTFGFYIKCYRALEEHTTGEPKTMTLLPSATSAGSLPQRALSTHTNGDKTADTCLDDLTILLVEDNLVNQKVLSRQLRKAGCKSVTVANNGQEALDYISNSTYQRRSEHDTTGKPLDLSIILLDIEMPVMDGLTCVRRIRELQGLGEIVAHIPVIAITANARSQQLSLALSAGMDDVITKPYSMADLTARIRSWTYR